MKHSSSSLMSETSEAKTTMPSNGNWNKITRNLYVDLFNLIVESRIPGINERGYGNGNHCPPLLGQNIHLCDLMKPECQKHQRMIHRLLRAVRHNIFEIEVLMLPDCCSDSKLSERIQNKEYMLLEKWSMTLLQSDRAQFSIEIPELLRAVRSFLHFSQISAWLSSTKGKSPANIYYWVKPTSDPSSTQFENSAEVHSFPLFKVNDELYGTVMVSYPSRKQYIPIIPCSKHPPHQGLRLIEDSNLTPAMPLNQQIGKHLQKNCDNQKSMISVRHSATDSDSLKTSSKPVLTNIPHSVNDINKANILKHAKSKIALENIPEVLSSSSSSQIFCKASSNSEMVLSNKIKQSFSKFSSQKNLCFNRSSFTTLVPRNESKLNILSNVYFPSFCEMNYVPVDVAHQSTFKPNIPVISNLPNLDMCSTTNALSINAETSHGKVSIMSHNCGSLLDTQTNSSRKSLKQKLPLQNEDLYVIPNKKICPYKERYVNRDSKTLLESGQSSTNTESVKRNCLEPFASLKKPNLVNCVQAKDLNKGIFSDKKNNSQKLSKNETFAETYISLEQESIRNKSKQSLVNYSNQKWIECSNSMLNNEGNHRCPNSFDKLKLVNLNEQTTYTNQITSKSLDPDFCFSPDCDNLISAKLDCKTSKNNDSKLKINCLKPLKSFYNEKEVFIENCLTSNQDTVLNNKSEIGKYLQATNNSEKLIEENFCNISDSCFLKNISNSSQTQSGKIKKRYINSFYKSRSSRLSSYHCSKHRKNSLYIKKEQDKILKLVKSSFSSKQSSSHLNTSSTDLSKFLVLNKFFKKRKKLISIPRLSKRCESDSKSSSLDTTRLKNPKTTVEDENANKFVPNQTFLEITKSKIDTANQGLLKLNSNNTSSLNSILLDSENEALLYRSRSWSYNFRDSSNNLHSAPKLDASQSIQKKAVASCSSFSNVLPQKATPYLDCFPRHKIKFARGRTLLGNFEESILKGCLLPVSYVKGFHTEIGASGSFCPNHITLPADVSFYDMNNFHSGTAPYVAHVKLGDTEYYVPKKGCVQITLFNPSETVVKMFVLNYDLSDMPPLCHTFIRQKTYYMPIGSMEDCPSSPKWLRFIVHLRFASSKMGKLYLHKDFKIVVLNKSNDDAASEFCHEPRELRSFQHVPTFSNL